MQYLRQVTSFAYLPQIFINIDSYRQTVVLNSIYYMYMEYSFYVPC